MEYLSGASLLVNLAFGLIMYFMKLDHTNTKENLKRIEGEVKEVRDTALKKDDFKDFREELWKRFDRIEETVQAIRTNK